MPVTKRMKAVLRAHQRLMDFATRSTYARRSRDPDIFDFTFGNPQEMPIPGFTDVLQKWVPPQDKDWYAYKLSEPEACEAVAASLSRWRGVTFEAQDIAMTNGALGAIATAFSVFLDPGYEVHSPDGTFYLLPKSPVEDDMVFFETLAARDVFVMPGTICSIPGYFRITLSSSRERLQQSLGAFAAARASVRA